jgi:hypothetical protein
MIRILLAKKYCDRIHVVSKLRIHNTLTVRGRLCDELADFMEEEDRSSYTLQLEAGLQKTRFF